MLGEFVLPERPRRCGPSTLLDLLGDLDVAEKAARQADRADGGLRLDRGEPGRARETRWTADGGRHPACCARAPERIYGFAAEERPWDGRWLVLTVGVPENNRALRQRLRTRLGWAGHGLGRRPGVWVTPRVDREPRGAAGVLEELGLLTGSWLQFVADGRAGVGDERSLARAAWDLDAVEQPVRGLPGAGRPSAGPRSDRQALVAQVRLVQEWRRFPLLDPGAAARAAAAALERATGRPRCSASGTRDGRRGPSRPGRSSPARTDPRSDGVACWSSQARPASVMTRTSRSACSSGGSCR